MLGAGELGAGELGAGALGGELGAAGSGLSGFRSCALTRINDTLENKINAKVRKPILIAGEFDFMSLLLTGGKDGQWEELMLALYSDCRFTLIGSGEP